MKNQIIIEQALEKLYELQSCPLEFAKDKRQRKKFLSYDAVINPIRLLKPKFKYQAYLNTKCKMVYRRTTEIIALNDSMLFTSQRYVYPSKVEWYIRHPKEIFVMRPHFGKLQYPLVFFREGKKKIGNGNHRIVAAMFRGIKEIPITKLEVIDVEYSDRYLSRLCRNTDKYLVIDISKQKAKERSMAFKRSAGIHIWHGIEQGRAVRVPSYNSI